jgi:hypothetical protein
LGEQLPKIGLRSSDSNSKIAIFDMITQNVMSQAMILENRALARRKFFSIEEKKKKQYLAAFPHLRYTASGISVFKVYK